MTLELTREKCKELGRVYFDKMNDDEFKQLVIIMRCSCGREKRVWPCTIVLRDHGHTSPSTCECGDKSWGSWISGADGMPFRG